MESTAFTLPLVDIDEADSILVDQLKVFGRVFKHTPNTVDDRICQLAIDSKDARVFMLDLMGFSPTTEQFQDMESHPVVMAAAAQGIALLDLIRFVREYGPMLMQIIGVIKALLDAFKELPPINPAPVPSPGSPPGTPGGVPGHNF
jgi:hypothetical protein